MNYQSHNPQFDFLKPTHILNGYFTSLVEQYNKVIHFEKAIKDPLLEKYKHREESLRVAVHRMGVPPPAGGGEEAEGERRPGFAADGGLE